MAKSKYYQTQDPNELLDQLIELRDEIKLEGLKIYSNWEDQITRNAFRESAENLSYYLALRQRDITQLQIDLIPWGLSSLGRLESKTLVTLDVVIATLYDVIDEAIEHTHPNPKEFDVGRRRLQKNTKKIFGKKPKNRTTRIMVTMPNEAIEDKEFIGDLIDEGMNVARINCAHNTEEEWIKMIENIQSEAKELNKDVRILMDIAGPKIRTDWVYTHLSKPKVSKGDLIRITRDFDKLPSENDVNVTAGCDLDVIYEQIEVDQAVLFDDGEIESVVKEVAKDEFILKVVKTKSKSVRVKAEKGMNFPNHSFKFDSLNDKDKNDINFACQHADIIGCSFVNDGEDIQLIQKEIEKNLDEKASEMSLMAKIETVRAVRNLPEIIYTAASKNPFGIMIARGDLAAESGYIDLAGLQQEIMWISEAGDIPVVWATEVLDTLVNDGIPTRSEVTDAAEGTRADCVMLNKGDYIRDGVQMLNRIIERMEPLQYKKTPILGKLNFTNVSSDEK
ncbi:MAG TPA: pyruvate kinase [Atopostipes sp.]|nr:pyruvate kinase [Atopostipes sp.]